MRRSRDVSKVSGLSADVFKGRKIARIVIAGESTTAVWGMSF